MAAALDILYWVCISHLLLFTMHLLPGKRRVRAARYAAGFTGGLIAFLLLQLGLAHDWPRALLLVFGAGLSSFTFFFWMLSLELFRERFRPGWRWLVLPAKIGVALLTLPVFPGGAAVQAGAASAHAGGDAASAGLSSWFEGLLLALGLASDEERAFLRLLPSALFSSVLVVLALREALRGYSDDLIEQRRRVRRIFLAACGGAALISLSLRLAMQSPELLQLHSLLVCLLILGLSYYIFLAAYDFRFDLLNEATASQSPANKAPPAIDRELQARLERLFESEKYYREEGLTIRRLAAKLDAREYRLRRLINACLGYRNFNDFLNRYRVQEACEILLQAEQAPIVRISLELGYRSPGSFNKAFRELTGKTPSEYRREALASGTSHASREPSASDSSPPGQKSSNA